VLGTRRGISLEESLLRIQKNRLEEILQPPQPSQKEKDRKNLRGHPRLFASFHAASWCLHLSQHPVATSTLLWL
jgi:hypothetical protein